MIYASLLCSSLVTCIILQKNGAGLHTASSCFWDNTMDSKQHNNVLQTVSTKLSNSRGPQWFFIICRMLEWELSQSVFVSLPGSCMVRWENKTTYCIVCVFGLAVWQPPSSIFPCFVIRHFPNPSETNLLIFSIIN